MAHAGVLHWLNQECEDLAKLEGVHEDPGVLRRMALDDLRNAYEFPLRVVLSGYVADVREVALPGGGGPQRYLEFVPAGFSPAAHRVLGPILFPHERRLEAGSVLTVALELVDPVTYSLHPAALLARCTALEARVAVEP